MYRWILIVVSLMSCAAVRPGYRESSECPSMMSPAEHESGVVRCRAMCSSYGRDFAKYTYECNCYCAPAKGQFSVKPESQASL